MRAVQPISLSQCCLALIPIPNPLIPHGTALPGLPRHAPIFPPCRSLTPVYVLRSRALEYRESAARACIDRVCSGTPEPLPAARYLRRAVELVADTGSNVQGLSKETIDYFQAHPSNAFDRIGLQLFAQGLYASGYRDRAAAIWSSLLLDADSDRSQQADLLRRCLRCGDAYSQRWLDLQPVCLRCRAGLLMRTACSELWQATGHSVWQPRPGSVHQASCRPTLPTRCSCYLDEPSMIGSGGDDYVFEKMVALFEGRVGRDRLVELTQEANLGDAFVLRWGRVGHSNVLEQCAEQFRWGAGLPMPCGCVTCKIVALEAARFIKADFCNPDMQALRAAALPSAATGRQRGGGSCQCRHAGEAPAAQVLPCADRQPAATPGRGGASPAGARPLEQEESKQRTKKQHV